MADKHAGRDWFYMIAILVLLLDGAKYVAGIRFAMGCAVGGFIMAIFAMWEAGGKRRAAILEQETER
jgi:hypothetical protein